MDYKGYNISDVQSLLMLDILQELKAVRVDLAELKKPAESFMEEKIVLKEEIPFEPVEEVRSIPVTRKPASKPKKRKTAKKGKVIK